MVIPSELSRSTEDYLKTIYKLESESEAAQTSAIAEALDIAPPSVTGMVKRLSESGLLEHVPYRGVRLTDAGRRAALRTLRRHRILESYLIEELGYDWDTVHDEAERLEHAVSDTLIERMADALGHPKYDPHGAPIPSVEGEMERPDTVPMVEIALGALGEVRMVRDQDSERLRFLGSLGLKPGVRFTLLERQPFNGPLTVEFTADGRKEVVGFELAQSVDCAQVDGLSL